VFAGVKLLAFFAFCFSQQYNCCKPTKPLFVSQDELKRRDNCLRVASEALRAGSSALIDRTNISIIQRAFFLDLARDEGVANVIVVLFDVRPEVCAQRILTREDHPTLAATDKSVEILLRFINEFER
jgi:predicted kinase